MHTWMDEGPFYSPPLPTSGDNNSLIKSVKILYVVIELHLKFYKVLSRTKENQNIIINKHLFMIIIKDIILGFHYVNISVNISFLFTRSY